MTSMTNPQKDERKPPQIIICDSNVIIMMTIFKPSIMFSATYSFGKLVVHQLVIEEIERWLRPESKKYKKFGKGLIEDALGYCRGMEVKFRTPAEQERKKYHGIMSGIESRLSDNQKSASASTTDKDLLVFAKKNNAKLATQEVTLRSLSKGVIGEDMLLSFEDLVVDAFSQTLLTKDEVLSELDTLSRYNESLRADGKTVIMIALGVSVCTGKGS
jgi:hypothetical protein